MPAKLTTEQFIERSTITHSDKYIYTKTDYITNKVPVIITCPTHGDFTQVPSHHMNGSECPTCARLKVSQILAVKNASNTADFITKATKVHGNTYDYSKVEYINSKTKVTIICPAHGEFTQTPNDHLDGCGCTICKYKNTKTLWSYSSWKAAGAISKQFNAYTLYALHCCNDTESFIKIGKTFQPLTTRFRPGVKMPYNWTVLFEHIDTADAISHLEKRLHAHFKSSSYLPKLPFGGSYECFEPNILPELTILKENLFV